MNIAELTAHASVKHATGEAEVPRLRATGDANAQAYRAGVESLGAQSYTLLQLMQIVGERQVRIVPDVAVNGTNGNADMVEGLLGMMLREQTKKAG